MAQKNSRDIRAFFAAFSKARKRTPETNAESERSKSPRLDSLPLAESRRSPENFSQRSIVDLVSSDGTDTPEPGPAGTLNGNRLSPALSAPRSSFTGTTSGASQFTASQRVVKNGEVVVTNSDADSDTSSDAPDLDQLLGMFKPIGQQSRISTQSSPSADTKRDSVKQSPGKTSLRSPGNIKRHFRVDHSVKSKRLLEDLVKKTNKERKTATDLEQVLTSINDNNIRIEDLETRINNGLAPQDIDPTTLASIVGEDEEGEGIDRLIKAVKRTEALQSQQEWSFFDPETPDVSFPTRPPESLKNLFGQRQNVEHALFTGFLEVLATAGEIKADEDSLEWMLRASLASAQDNLYNAYCEMLLYSNASKLIEPDWIWRLFSLMGASGDALDLTHKVQPRIRLGKNTMERSRDWSRVRRILQIITKVASCLPMQSRREALLILCRLALDVEVRVHHQTIILLRSTIDALLSVVASDQIDDEISTAINDLMRHVTDTRFRLHLLRALASNSARTSALRHRLALACFLEHTDQSSHNTFSGLINRLTHHISHHANFHIHSDTDFVWLAAIIDILDIAVDKGRLNQVDRTSSSADDSPIRAEDLDEDDDRNRFNRDVDRLANAVNNLATSIRDSGANHLTRTEAKESLDALYVRLLYVVRTEPRPKKSVFGGRAGGGIGDEQFMQRFLNAARSKGAETGDAEQLA